MILKRYLYKEILQNFFAIFLILILIVISLRFVRYLGDVAAGKMTAEIVYQMLTLKLITSLSLIIPLCLYLSLFTTLGRFQRENELTAMSSAGLGHHFFLSTILRLAAFFSLLVLLLTMFAFPWAEKNIDLLKQKANHESDITGINAGSFKEFSRGNRVLYVEDIEKDTNNMKNVFLQVTEQGKTGVLTSDSATIHTNQATGERSVIFMQGKRYVGVPNQLDYSITEFHRYSIKMEQEGYDTTYRPISRVSSKELFESWKTGNPQSSSELQWRLSLPVSVLLLSAFAVLVARSTKEMKGPLLLVSAILVFFIYNNLLNISHDMVKRDSVAAFPGLWWPHFVMFIIILSIIYIPALLRKSVQKNNENT